MIRSRLVAGLWVALGSAAAFGAGWLIWLAPHCQPVAAHAYYTPLAHVPAKWTPVRRQEHAQTKEWAQCGRDAPAPGSAQASGR
jgi:hypothetical protein